MTRKRRLFRSRRARRDLIEIWRDIWLDHPEAADSQLDRINESCFRLIRHPEMGPARDDIRPVLRHLVVGQYLIMYRAVDDGIEVVRVIHGRRDLFHLR